KQDDHSVSGEGKVMAPGIFMWVLLLCMSTVLVLLTASDARSLRRRILRFSGLVFPMAVHPLFGICVYRISLLIPAAVLLALEAVGKKKPEKSLIGTLISPIAKEGEREHFSGISAWFAGVFIGSLSPGGIGPAAAAMGTVADPWASMAGTLMGGRKTKRGKTFSGSAACFLSAFWAGTAFSLLFPGWGGTLIHVSAGALSIAASEHYTPGTYDNITVFIAGAAAMTLSAALT
ncbi:MAG: hypothetical protein PHS90_00635, partial [Synergistaceae bacterium]|nr:hypothetical protein [Synergistaceae bacterium]